MKKCPYCEFELDKKPTRKKKCPNCSEFIFVRRGELYTEKQVKEIIFKSKWLSWLERYGASEEMFTQIRERLSKQFGFEASVNDTIWGLMNTLTGQQEDLIDMVQIYLLMGDFVEEEGKDPEPYVRQAMQLEETRIKKEVLGYKKELGEYYKLRVKVSTCNDDIVCDRCNEISKRTYNIDDFLKKMPIPNNCSNPRGCRCGVNIEFD